MVGLGFLPGGGPSANLNAGSNALGISADGSVVVGYSNIPNVNGGYEAFRWTQGTGMVGLGDLPEGIFYSSAAGVSADGSVVVGIGNSTGGYFNGYQAFRWTQGTGMVGLGNLPGGVYSSALGVSADGSIVVGASHSDNASKSEAFRWTQGTGMVGLGDLPGGSFSSGALGVSADGSVVVGHSSGAYGLEAFRWTQATGMVGLGFLPVGGFSVTAATGVSADGSVVVGHSGSGEVFIWNSTQGMRSLREILTNDYGLNLTGWTLTGTGTTRISADGLTIVGSGTNPSGNTEAWIARLNPQNNPSVPEPSSILGLGLFSLVGFLIKKRS
jgi:probable HAF family extracellular repeat protein